MKIRNGFVSNSSSSSFIVAGKRLNTLKEIKEAINKGGCVNVVTDDFGSDGYYYLNYLENEDVFDKYFDKAINNFWWSFWEVFQEAENIRLDDLVKIIDEKGYDFDKVEIFQMEADYHKPKDLEEFILEKLKER